MPRCSPTAMLMWSIALRVTTRQAISLAFVVVLAWTYLLLGAGVGMEMMAMAPD
jgi:hypothetical protein